MTPIRKILHARLYIQKAKQLQKVYGYPVAQIIEFNDF